MLRFVLVLVVVCVLWRWAFGRWPWHALATRPTREQALFRARKLLGVEEHASREEIKAAHKRLIALVHPDRGGTSAQVHEANAARDLLLARLPDPGAVSAEDEDGSRD